MRRSDAALPLLTVAAAALPAQEFLGFTYNSVVSATSRGSLGAAAGEVMTRIAGSEYGSWGTSVPGARTIHSLFFIVQDQIAGAVGAPFDIKLYPESVAVPDTPDLTAGVVFAAGVSGPTGTGTVAAVAMVVTPLVPVSVPLQGGGDVFVSFALPAVSPGGNLSVQIQLGAGTVFGGDNPGPAQQPGTPPAPANTHGLTFLPPAQITHDFRRMHVLDVAQNCAGGGALTITNQAAFPVSHNPPPTGAGACPGTQDFFSGLAPDVNGFAPGRVDDLGFRYQRTGLAGSGALVLFAIDFAAGLATEIPLPGIGNLGLSNGAFVSRILIAPTTDEVCLTLLVPTGFRPLLPGTKIQQQAAAFFAGSIIAGPSVCQSF